MKLIVGLGNYGKEYDNTRHNMGFRYIDAFAQAHNTKIDKAKMDGLLGGMLFQVKNQVSFTHSSESSRLYKILWATE